MKHKRSLPERRDSHLASNLERDRAKKRLGLTPSISAMWPVKTSVNQERRARRERDAKKRAAHIAAGTHVPRAGYVTAQVINHVAREGRIPIHRESLMLASEPTELLAKVAQALPEVEEDMSKNRSFRRGDEVIVRIRHQGRQFTEHAGKVKDVEGVTAIIDRGGKAYRFRLADMRRNMPGSAYGGDDSDVQELIGSKEEEVLTAKIGETAATKIKPPEHFETAAKSGELFSEVLKSTRLSMAFPFPLLAKALRIDPAFLKALEEADAVPDDDLVQRFVDVCNLDQELTRVVSAFEHTKGKAEAAEAAAKEAQFLEEQEQERRRASMKKSPGITGTAAFERFGERLSKVCPVPFNSERRAQWDTAVRILFEIQEQDAKR